MSLGASPFPKPNAYLHPTLCLHNAPKSTISSNRIMYLGDLGGPYMLRGLATKKATMTCPLAERKAQTYTAAQQHCLWKIANTAAECAEYSRLSAIPISRAHMRTVVLGDNHPSSSSHMRSISSEPVQHDTAALIGSSPHMSLEACEYCSRMRQVLSTVRHTNLARSYEDRGSRRPSS